MQRASMFVPIILSLGMHTVLFVALHLFFGLEKPHTPPVEAKNFDTIHLHLNGAVSHSSPLPPTFVSPSDDHGIMSSKLEVPSLLPNKVDIRSLSDDSLNAVLQESRIEIPEVKPLRSSDPAPIHPIEPTYPVLARRAGFEGVVILDIDIDSQGRAIGTRIIDSRSHQMLEQAAIHAAMVARYTPKIEMGIPVSGILRVRINFQLEP